MSTCSSYGQACTSDERLVIIAFMKAVIALLCLGLLGGCAEGTPNAEAPDDSDELYEDDPVEQTAGGGEAKPADDAEDDAEPASEGGGAASPQDMQEILQLVINDEALDPYLHLEEPGRFPLQISGGEIPSGIELVKNTQPVKVVPEPDKKEAPVLVFTSIEATSKEARIKYRYDVEGVRGSATVKKLEGRWQLSNSRVTEY